MSRRRGIRDSRIADLVDLAEQRGWTVRLGGNGHLLVYPPDGGKPVSVSMTLNSKEPRAWLNTRAAFRRGGLDV